MVVGAQIQEFPEMILHSKKYKGILPLAENLIKINKCKVLATGITTGYEIADNQLREFVMTNKIVNILREKGVSTSELILINDTLDPFSEIYYKRLIKFDKNLSSFKKYIGWPISKIPSPYGTHESLSSYFEEILTNKLREQMISPKIIDTHQSYMSEYYQKKLRYILENESKILKDLKEKFNYTPQTLYRPICQECRRIDSTLLNYRKKMYTCKNCDKEFLYDDLPEGKLIWKIDCAMRWNHNKADFEAFTLNYFDPATRVYEIISFISNNYLDGHTPATHRFVYYRMNSRLKNIFLSLPYDIIEDIFLKNIGSDILVSDEKIISLTKNYSEGKRNFFDTAYLLHIFFPSFVLDNSTLNHINQRFFNIKFSPNVDNYQKIRKKIEIAYNFANRFIKPQIAIKTFDSINLDSLNRDTCQKIIDLLLDKEVEPKYQEEIYPLLFGSRSGPSVKTIKEILTDHYKMELIKRLRKKI